MLKHTNKAQALLELAVLSAILIFAIGALVSIGISYNRNQELSMRAHRNAMAMAYNPVFREHTRQINMTMVEDQPTVETTGSSRQKALVPYMSSAGGVWSNKIYYDYELINLKKVDLGSWGGIRDFLDDLTVSYLDLPSTQYLINEKLHYLPTGMYSTSPIRMSVLNCGIKHEDMYEYLSNGEGVKGLTCFPMPGITSWVKCIVPAKKIDEGDRLDIDGDGKEELILDKLSLKEITKALEIGEYLPSFVTDFFDDKSVFLVLDDQEGLVDMTKDSKDIIANDLYYQLHPGEDYESVSQGMQGKYRQDNVLDEATLLVSENQNETVNQWETDSGSEVTHYIKYNDTGRVGSVVEQIRERLEEAGLNFEMPGEELSKIMAQNELVLWRTPK